MSPACPGCGLELPPRPCRCGYRPFAPPPQPPPQPRARQLPALKLELGQVSLVNESYYKNLPPLKLNLGEVTTEPAPTPPPPRVSAKDLLFLPSARAITAENLLAESRFLAQRNDDAQRHFMRLVDRVAPDRSEWREEFLVW